MPLKNNMNLTKIKLLACCLISLFVSCNSENKQNEYTGKELAELNARLNKGWNTWNTNSVLSHVLLPECFSINLMLKDGQSGDTLKEALIGREDYDSKEYVIAGPRTYNGSYTELEIKWRDIKVHVQSASQKNDLYLLITPIKTLPGDSLLIVPQMLWDHKGDITIDRNKITVQTQISTTSVYVNGDRSVTGPGNIRVSLGHALSLSLGDSMSLKEVENAITLSRAGQEREKLKFRKTPELYDAMHSVLAWNTIYDPINNRVINPVSRNWSAPSGGWVLFDWDTYFASYMLSTDNKDLAYANAIAITNEITKKGFIPNNSQPGHKSEDRSEPQVGALIVREIFRKYQEKWFLKEVFDELLSWNRWRAANRDIDGYLVYGSDPYDYGASKYRSAKESGKIKAAKWESGMDNSPMWDDAVFDTISHRMMLADVGLMSLYINDCQNLSEIAAVLEKKEIAKELALRAKKYSEKLKTLWNEEFGLYLNKDLVTGKFSYRLSPTLFYPLLAKVPDQHQAARMMKEHFFNPKEFWGEYIMPTIARNDPAYKDNKYWRGRIWAPVNFLVYMGLRNYDLPDARKEMVEKSRNLLLKSWIAEKHVYENYNAETGKGDDAGSWSDKFYHWGALLGFIGIIEEGYVPSPQLPLKDEK
jgi:putative isomerase